MIKKLFYFAAIVLFVSCGNSGKFSVSGSITDAENEILYFEQNGLLKDSLIDSVKLNKEGRFSFKTQLPKYPELYRLRLKNQNLVLGVDSAAKIQIEGTTTDLLAAKIEGSQVSRQIQDLRKSVLVLQGQFDAVTAEKDAEKSKALLEEFKEALDKHQKQTQAMILQNPGSMAAYFALYQQISGNYIFSPYVKEQRPYYQAVATAFHNSMPEYERSKNLYTLVMAALSEERMAKRQFDWEQVVEVEQLGSIDIELKNQNGYPQKLSQFKGKPILLDFSAYGLETSVDYTFSLREIHKKYAPRGLEIYQVSLDQNRLLWERAVSTIPWTCVIDPDGSVAKTYNVQEIPTIYLINKAGDIVGKYSTLKSAEADLERIL